MDCSTRPSNVRVCRFRHPRITSRHLNTAKNILPYTMGKSQGQSGTKIVLGLLRIIFCQIRQKPQPISGVFVRIFVKYNEISHARRVQSHWAVFARRRSSFLPARIRFYRRIFFRATRAVCTTARNVLS